jgi:hypothetical protein
MKKKLYKKTKLNRPTKEGKKARRGGKNSVAAEHVCFLFLFLLYIRGHFNYIKLGKGVHNF